MLKLTRPFQYRRCERGPRFWHHFMRRQGKPFGLHASCDVNNFLGQFKGKELSELIEAHIPEYLSTEKLKEIINQFKTGEQTDKPIDETFLLDNVGKVLHEILSSVDKQTEESKSKEKKEEAASNNSSTEPKTTIPPASASASTTAPPLGNLIEQVQTIFAPIFQRPTTVTTTSPVDNQKKIDECIERMTSMGFVDSNGVLTELIKSKKGDLDQVLDALNPRNYKN